MAETKKCIVWDLDNTLWDGVCLEGKVKIKKGVHDIITEMDKRGILHSIASRGDEGLSLKVLKENKLTDFFLAPQINWLPKSQSILKISKELELSLDSIAFIDDDEFEREQISYMLDDVLTIDAGRIYEISDWKEFNPVNISKETKERRYFYQAEMKRKETRHSYKSREDFLLSCNLQLNVRQLREEDIPRVLELMSRTHQLNSTGIIITGDELTNHLNNGRGKSEILVAELTDKFGWYGVIGTAMIVKEKPVWKLKYLSISCRVMGRGIERAFLAYMVKYAYNGGFEIIEAEFRDTGRNRMMRVLYQMSGLINTNKPDTSENSVYSADTKNLPQTPKWIKML
ncbi:MAG: HAD-IIIC family phosphatase [Ignavibacteriae bacterium]|nr:HAD-IIIC family phosphatase [Ignavibacteriota bacterium]